jgi:D-3-phosphoglycerate dehydrogenase
VPGVLGEINHYFSSRGINISAEYLQTDADLGYVILETESELDSSVIKDLRNIPNTIRVRILY